MYEQVPKGTTQCLFWGFGTDGTVGANKQAIKTIGENTNLYTQGHFAYDSHKGGGVTMSHVRFGPEPIKSEYEICRDADYVACHHSSYIHKFDLLSTAKPGGTFVLNWSWPLHELEQRVPNEVKEQIARLGLNFYTIDATGIAHDTGLGQRINMVMQAAFYHLSGVLESDHAIELLKQDIENVYGKKGPKVVQMNKDAVDQTVAALNKYDYPASWANATTDAAYASARTFDVMHQPDNFKRVTNKLNEDNRFVEKVMHPVTALKGDELPVSAFEPGGFMPVGTTQYEKRGIAAEVPVWKPDKCTQCNYCNIVCPHAVIRPFLFTKDELKTAPAGFESRRAQGGAEVAGLNYSIQLATLDCTGCAVCVESCPDDALYMAPFASAAEPQIPHFEFAMSVPNKGDRVDKYTVKGSQFQEPLMEFSGACAGCGETPYVKLLTQLFGDRLMIANASGCSSVWGGTATTNPYTTLSHTNKHAGRGPAWGRSLFEDNAEYGLGMALATSQRRALMRNQVRDAVESNELTLSPELRAAFTGWLDSANDMDTQGEHADRILAMLETEKEGQPLLEHLARNKNLLPPISQWIIGGDGWAYDIGFSGLDHVLAKGGNVNILVLDTEMYSNTGGQVSKATAQSAVVKFASSGKSQAKKELGRIAMLYDNVYVAQVAMGASYQQTLQALKEAEEYDGPSLVIAYSPCIDWGIDMAHMMDAQKLAVDVGYWPLYRYNPDKKGTDEQPLSLDSRRIKSDIGKMMAHENRFAQLLRNQPQIADKLHASLKQGVSNRLHTLTRESMDEFELLDMLKKAVGEQTGEKILILYASETGNTADLAKMLQFEMKRRGVRTSCMPFDDFAVEDLPEQTKVINLVATCGQGEWPGNSKTFWSEINNAELPPDFLKDVQFTTFAMGDSGYVFFNEAGKLMDARFKQLGAQEIMPMGMGDDQDEDKWETAWEAWEPELWNELGTDPPPAELLPAAYTLELHGAGSGMEAETDTIMPHDAGGKGVMCPMTTSRLLTPGGRDVRHIEWDIRGTGLSYDAGDALGVWSTNAEDKVAEFLDWYGVAPDSVVEAKRVDAHAGKDLPKTFTASQLFTQVLDIFGRPKRQFYEMMGIIAEDPAEKEQLAHLVSKEGRGDMRKLIDDTVTYADVMQLFPSARMPLEYMMDFVPAIKPRLYSIASASEMHPDHIHLCIVEEDWENSKGPRHGQSTWFVRNNHAGIKWGHTVGLRDAPEEPFGTLDPSEAPQIPVRVNPAVVHLPDSPKTPLIMVGLGTGMAPFRAFIQQRAVLRSRGEEVGPMLLYFGARYEKTEYLYGDEIEAYHADGLLTDLKKAFSRDQEHKIYAQHRIEEDPHLLYDYLIKQEGSFYLCGPAGNMPAQMRTAVINALQIAGGHSEEESEKMVTDMQINGRYGTGGRVW